MPDSTLGTGKVSLEHSNTDSTSLSAWKAPEPELRSCLVRSPVSESEMASYSGVIRNRNGLRSLWSSVETLDSRTPNSVSIPSLSLPSSLPVTGSVTVAPASLVT